MGEKNSFEFLQIANISRGMWLLKELIVGAGNDRHAVGSTDVLL